MSTRVLAQWVIFIGSIVMLTVSLMGVKFLPKRKWTLFVPVLYFLVEIIFYFIVLVLGFGLLGNTLSPYRSVMELGIMAAFIVSTVRGEIRWK